MEVWNTKLTSAKAEGDYGIFKCVFKNLFDILTEAQWLKSN